MVSPESGRSMTRGEKVVALVVGGKTFKYRQPGWWRSLDDPEDHDGQLVDDDDLVAEMALRTAEALVRDDPFPPVLIRAIRSGGKRWRSVRPVGSHSPRQRNDSWAWRWSGPTCSPSRRGA